MVGEFEPKINYLILPWILKDRTWWGCRKALHRSVGLSHQCSQSTPCWCETLYVVLAYVVCVIIKMLALISENEIEWKQTHTCNLAVLECYPWKPGNYARHPQWFFHRLWYDTNYIYQTDLQLWMHICAGYDLERSGDRPCMQVPCCWDVGAWGRGHQHPHPPAAGGASVPDPAEPTAYIVLA